MPDPPRGPDYYDKVNYVIRAWSTPCEIPWHIYVETLWPAALEAFITLATFGWDDVARGYWRPRGLGRRSKKKRRGGRGRAVPRLPELGETLGSRLPEAEEVKGRKWTHGTKTLWRIDTLLQRGLFWWLVADVTFDFAYNWTSLLYEGRVCEDTSKGRFSYSDEQVEFRGGGGWSVLAITHEDYSFPPPNWTIDHGFAGPNGCTVMAAVDVKKATNFDPPTETAVRIIERFSGKVLAQTGPGAVNPDGTSSLPVMGNMGPGQRFQVQAWHNAIFANYKSRVVVASEL